MEFLKDIVNIDLKENIKKKITNLIRNDEFKYLNKDWENREFLNDLMFKGEGIIYSKTPFFNKIKNVVIKTIKEIPDIKYNDKYDETVKDFFDNMNSKQFTNHKFRNTIAGLYVDGNIKNIIKDSVFREKIHIIFLKRIFMKL